MASAAYYVPLDVFNSHKPTLISELEDPVESVAGYCRDANIIDSQFHDELVLVTGKKHKAEKLVNAISDRIRDQSAQVEQEQCVLRRFIGALRRESSCESMVIQLEKSLSREDVAAVAQESTSLKDPLNEYISKDHQRKIGKEMKYWKKWANALNLTGGQMTGIDDDKSLDYDMKGGKVLELWAKKYKATYRILCEVALKLEDRAMARIVCTMVNGKYIHSMQLLQRSYCMIYYRMTHIISRLEMLEKITPKTNVNFTNTYVLTKNVHAHVILKNFIYGS